MLALARPVQLDGDERGVLDFDPATLRRGLQPPAPVFLAPQHAGEEAHQLLPVDRRASVKPGAVSPDHER